MTINGTNDAPSSERVTAWMRGRSDGRHQLEARAAHRRSVIRCGRSDLHGANRTRQAHTARSTSAPMACGRTLNNDRRSSRAGRRGYVNGNLHSDVGRRAQSIHQW
ncbi:hypothetical protein OH492_25180 [Vibrio chagasii]|nr:hypothetical protein [Vibrio chagasii]